MYFDDQREAREVDHWLTGLADQLREHMLGKSNPFGEKQWRVAGYRYARALAQGSAVGVTCVREFAEGMRAFCNENATLGGPVLYDVKHAETVEDRGAKLLALATHKSTGEAEARAAFNGLVKLFANKDLAIISAERVQALRRTLSRMTESMNFLRREHPTIFLFAPDDSNPSPIDR